MLRTLPTKEIKVYHSSYGVGIAYMLVVKVELKKCKLFSPGYFGQSRPGDPEIPRKYAISVQSVRSVVYRNSSERR